MIIMINLFFFKNEDAKCLISPRSIDRSLYICIYSCL